MTKKELLNEINQADYRLWRLLADEDRLQGFKLLYQPASPSNYWLNSVFQDDVFQPITTEQLKSLSQFYSRAGCTGFIRDFTGGSGGAGELAYLAYLPVPGSSRPRPSLTMSEYGQTDILDFAHQVRDCFGYSADFPQSFTNRMLGVSKLTKSRFLKFHRGSELVGVVSLFEVGGGWWSLMNLGIRFEFRNQGLSHALLATLLFDWKDRIFLATENSALIKSALPRAGFIHAGNLVPVPLNPSGKP